MLVRMLVAFLKERSFFLLKPNKHSNKHCCKTSGFTSGKQRFHTFGTMLAGMLPKWPPQ
jgi:hypothetical protein